MSVQTLQTNIDIFPENTFFLYSEHLFVTFCVEESVSYNAKGWILASIHVNNCNGTELELDEPV